MKTKLPFLRAAALGLAVLCAFPAWSQTTPLEPQALSIDAITSTVTGFEVGSSTNDRVAYVFFDAQCSHCGTLWEATKPLLLQMKFVWIPVAMLNPKSMPQGADILGAGDPAAAMQEHEALWLAKKGGLPISVSVPTRLLDALETNTRVLKSFGKTTVPVLVAQNSQGLVVSVTGTRTTEALAELLELDYVSGQ